MNRVSSSQPASTLTTIRSKAYHRDDLAIAYEDAAFNKNKYESTIETFPIAQAFAFYFSNDGKCVKPSRTTGQIASCFCFYATFYFLVLLPLLPIGVLYRYLRLNVDHPHFSNVILEEPGLNFRPYPREEGSNNKSWGTLVYFNRYDRDHFQFLIENIDSVVNKYEAHTEQRHLTQAQDMTWTKVCSFESPVDVTHACILNAQRFGTYCYRNMEYGYPDGQPCFLIRINKVHGWIPEPYDSFQQLKEAGFPLEWEEEDFDPRYLPISCTGETIVDEELLGPADYIFPFEEGKKGIPLYFFPYLNQLNYKAPGIMVNFWNVTVSVVIRIKCLLWARNVPHSEESGHLRGGVRFELMVDNGNVERDDMPNETVDLGDVCGPYSGCPHDSGVKFVESHDEWPESKEENEVNDKK